MKRIVLVVLGMVLGFGAAITLLPAQGANDMGAYRQLDLFSDAFERVRANYVRPVDDSELVDNAIEGMVSALDPHSSYMDAKSFADMQIQTKGEFGGLGIEVTMEDGLVKVVSPIDDTPAAKAGIKPGDYIAAIDNTPVQGMALNDAIDKMRGPQGSKVTLTILRQGQKKPFDVVLARAIIQVDSVKWHRENDVAYIRITGFNEQTNVGLEKAVRDLKKQIGPGLKGYVIDLRNNPGGLLDQAISVSDDLMNAGEIVSTRGRHAEDTQRYDAKNGDITDNKPIVVLINGGTASASEIVAGALAGSPPRDDPWHDVFRQGFGADRDPAGRRRRRAAPDDGALFHAVGPFDPGPGHHAGYRGGARGRGRQAAQGHPPQRSRPAGPSGRRKRPQEGPRGAGDPCRMPGKKYDDFQLSYALDLLRGKPTVTASADKNATAKAN